MNTHYEQQERLSGTKLSKKQVSQNENTMPLIYLSEYKDSFDTVLYKMHRDGNYDFTDFRHFYKINMFDYYLGYDSKNYCAKWKNASFFDESYGIGIRVNPFYTKLVLLDFDHVNYSFMKTLAEHFLTFNVNGVDIILSSPTESIIHDKRFHLIVGLDSYYNISSFYSEIPFPGSCSGFNNVANNTKGEIILRISDKKNNTAKCSTRAPIALTCYRKRVNKWHMYNGTSIIYPDTNNDIKENCTSKQTRIHVRGKYVNKRTKQKSEGEKTSTINSIKDIINFSNSNR